MDACLVALRGAGDLTVALLEFCCFLLEHGMGRKGEEAEGDGEGGDQFATGTGMGAGEGIKDVSKEIEDEAQMEGLENEQENDAEVDKLARYDAVAVGLAMCQWHVSSGAWVRADPWRTQGSQRRTRGGSRCLLSLWKLTNINTTNR